MDPEDARIVKALIAATIYILGMAYVLWPVLGDTEDDQDEWDRRGGFGSS